jgi:hypothetical protein
MGDRQEVLERPDRREALEQPDRREVLKQPDRREALEQPDRREVLEQPDRGEVLEQPDRVDLASDQELGQNRRTAREYHSQGPSLYPAWEVPKFLSDQFEFLNCISLLQENLRIWISVCTHDQAA